MKKYFLLILFGVMLGLQSQAHVAIRNPVGGETFSPGEIVSIEWEILVTHNTLNWDLFFSGDGGITWEILQLDIHRDSLSYQWTVPETTTTQARIKIVQDNEGQDYEDSSGDFTITLPTGIKQELAESNISIYPNPATNKINIILEGFEIEEVNIYALSGQVIIKDISVNGIIDISDLQPGMYILEVTADNTRIRKKLIVE